MELDIKCKSLSKSGWIDVEVYLSREQAAVFCATRAGLPADARSWFVGNRGMQPFEPAPVNA